MTFRHLFPILLTAFAAFSLSACSQSTESAVNGASGDEVSSGVATAPSGLDLASLTIQSGDTTQAFTVEVARTAQEQARGLMFRTELAPDKGMIFPFSETRPANFWMKNTQISLDIIFVRSDGTIESIAANTVPYSEEGVPSGEPVAMVLELVAGRSAELGLKSGDVVQWVDPRS